MLRDALAALLTSAGRRLVDSGRLPAEALAVEVEIADNKQPEHGDFACNYAMSAARASGMNPRALGELLASELANEDLLDVVEVAGPGFLNFRLKPTAIAAAVLPLLEQGKAISKPTRAKPSQPEPLRINVEFVSVNPNGPITIGSGRGAAYGSTLCNVLEAAGNQVHREYYINDGVNSEQMRLFAESIRALALGEPVPEGGYRGDYVRAVAAAITTTPDRIDAWQQQSQGLMLAAQESDLAAFGVEFDTWFSEQSLHDAGDVENHLRALQAGHVADERPLRAKLKLKKGGAIEDVEIETQTGDDKDDTAPDSPSPQTASTEAGQTLWLRSTKFGDDMDRVLRRRDGRLTYIASDVAYHADKFNRPPSADKLITILGPDHHGYIGRLHAVLAAYLLAEGQTEQTRTNPHQTEPLSEVEAKLYSTAAERDACRAALEEARKRLEVQIFQLVRFVKDGKPAPMRKRDGNIYALIDLIKEIGEKVQPEGTDEEKQRAGKDVARFFYLMRSHDTTFDFDLDLAERQSDENPVFYVQYAHARICSVLAKAAEAGMHADPHESGLLTHAREAALIKKIADLPWEVSRCAEDYGVHRLTTYAIELARLFHAFYSDCKVVQPEEPALSGARLALCELTRNALKATLDLLGISAPERM